MGEIRVEYVTAQEASRMLGYSDAHVRRLCIEGKFNAKKWGDKSWMIPTDEVMKHKVLRKHS